MYCIVQYVCIYTCAEFAVYCINNRPGVPGGVLLTPSIFIQWFSQQFFSSKSWKHLHSRTVWDKDLKFWKNVQLPPYVICHVSHITCHMSRVTCYASNVLFCFGRLSDRASWWRVCYQRGLTRLYFSALHCHQPLYRPPASTAQTTPWWSISMYSYTHNCTALHYT